MGWGLGGSTDLNALDSKHAKVTQKHPSSVECLYDAVREREREREREKERERERNVNISYVYMAYIPDKQGLQLGREGEIRLASINALYSRPLFPACQSFFQCNILKKTTTKAIGLCMYIRTYVC